VTFPLIVLTVALLGALTLVVVAIVPRRYAVIAAIAGAVAVTCVVSGTYVRQYADDSYITLRYARNLADGVGPVFNRGEHVEGYTNFLWMVLLAGMHKAGFDLIDASYVLAFVSLATLFGAMAWAWSAWSREAGGAAAHPLTLAIALLAVAANDAVVWWTFSGLETISVAALFTLGVALRLREARRGAGIPWSALAFVAAALSRPEMAAMSVATAAWTAGEALVDRDRMQIRRAAAWIVAWAVPYGAYFAWRWSYYGHPLPNTFYAKVSGTEEQISAGIDYLRTFGGAYLLPLALAAGAGLQLAGRRIRRDALYAGALAAAWFAVVAGEGGDAFGHGRFVAPVLPLIYVAGATGGAAFLDRARVTPRAMAAAGVCAAVLFAFAGLRGAVDSLSALNRNTDHDLKAYGLWLHDNVPPDYVMATYAIGRLPYYSELPTLDMLGLADETIAHTDVPGFGRGVRGHEKYNLDYVLETVRPEIIVHSSIEPVVQDRAFLERRTTAIPAYDALFHDPRTFALYEPVAVRYGDRWLNFLQRKDTLGSIAVDWTQSRGYLSDAPR
jgi:hypothetical protein